MLVENRDNEPKKEIFRRSAEDAAMSERSWKSPFDFGVRRHE
jgi:hypothetical protein